MPKTFMDRVLETDDLLARAYDCNFLYFFAHPVKFYTAVRFVLTH